jgi:hypothetical protein
MQCTSVGVLGMLLALILTVVTDLALFDRRHRAFWVGFTVAGWVCAALALSYREEMRSHLLSYGSASRFMWRSCKGSACLIHRFRINDPTPS